ncbi:PREDICTED: piggyBac transposable element-derived protein 4-like [Trachymyrmex cornetzi]|uniref:piggyBac transposable element-derived protein 4-like n=1 Tax=Trachymyrmex cornetzi TaxID=471704 RepID=UPI00084F410D|nr:PREDICTED: piggyBac transposable element-derived protein 4-like [Trachymyrmex cornetzi]
MAQRNILQEYDHLPPFGEVSSCEENNVESEEDVQSEEEFDDHSDVEESTIEQVSGLEREIPGINIGRRRSFIRGRNDHKWSLNAPEVREEQRPMTIHVPKANLEAQQVRTSLDSWSLLFSDNILKIIVKFTNKEINKIVNISNQTVYNRTDVTEIRAFFGILYFSGVQKNGLTNPEEMWSNEFGSNLYRSVMSLGRFILLGSCLCFDDKNTRAERKLTDGLAAIREIWDIFIANCTKYYTPSQNCTIDEQLLEFKGRFHAKVYIKGKSDRCGIKIISMNDAANGYMINALPYIGRVITERENVPSYYVRKLSTPIHNTNRNITCGNRFTSVEIVDKMMSKYSLTMVGTIRKNKRHIPILFSRPISVGTARYAYDNGKTLLSYSPKKNKIVLLLSSLHERGRTDENTEKPEIITFYKSTKGGTDTFDQLCKYYSTVRKTNQWTMRFFFGMLDQAGVNAYRLYELNQQNQQINRRSFLKNLTLSLIKPELERRLTILTLRKSLKLMIWEILNVEDPDSTANTGKMEKRKRCYFCPTKKDRKTFYCCTHCKKPICEDHRSPICSECIP